MSSSILKSQCSIGQLPLNGSIEIQTRFDVYVETFENVYLLEAARKTRKGGEEKREGEGGDERTREREKGEQKELFFIETFENVCLVEAARRTLGDGCS